jgi:saccharopine dehydrogenase (NADP+, L-glutamate forming)
MNKIVVLGAGRSALYCIEYLVEWCSKNEWLIDVADLQADAIKSSLSDYSGATAIDANLADPEIRKQVIRGANYVVSMLPAFMHPLVAKDCIEAGANLVTASYESDDIRSLRPEIEKKGLQFLNECGLDPGLDHMSAMRIIHRLRNQGAIIHEFKSYCGGLIAPECIDNPFGYKFSWNPRNVILAGQGTARFLENEQLKFIPYNRLFANPETITLSDDLVFDGYPNRDSLTYREVYGLDSIQTLIRGTLRHPGFCRAWNILVQLGITDDSYHFPLKNGSTYLDFISAYLPSKQTDPGVALKQLLAADYEQDAIDKIIWTGLFSNEEIPIKQGSPAAILQELLERKLKLLPGDRDLIVMQHEFSGILHNQKFNTVSSLYLEGEDSHHTAMAKTVGLPLVIGLKQLIEKRYTKKGLMLPVEPAFYEPVLNELESLFDISFSEKETVDS